MQCGRLQHFTTHAGGKRLEYFVRLRIEPASLRKDDPEDWGEPIAKHHQLSRLCRGPCSFYLPNLNEMIGVLSIGVIVKETADAPNMNNDILEVFK